MTDGKTKFKDWRWRLNHLYKIVDKQGKKRTFKENSIQRILNSSKKRRKIILKARQFGCTTNEIIKQLDYACFNRNVSCCILADKRENLERIFKKVRLAHKSMPHKVRPEVGKGGGSKFELTFPELESNIYVTLEAHGTTIQWLHISEAAYADPKRIRETLEAVPKHGIVTFESTPNGMGNDFYRRWVTPSRYEKHFFPWFIFDEYSLDTEKIVYTQDELQLIQYVKDTYGIELSQGQIAFRRAKQNDLKEEFIEKYPEDDISCFLASGGAAFDLSIVHELMKNTVDPIVDTGTLKVWKEYDRNKVYACGADTAEGKGGDYSVATMYEADTMTEVAQIRSNRWKPSVFADEINKLCRMYHTGGRPYPLLGVERNNHGHAVLLKLDETHQYPHLYEYKDGDFGWRTDNISRPLMIDTFIDGVEEGLIELNSRETLGECLTLIDNNGKIEAEEGENDDTIIASSIAVQMCLEVKQATAMQQLSQMIRL